jgi:hypothetical protein
MVARAHAPTARSFSLSAALEGDVPHQVHWILGECSLTRWPSSIFAVLWHAAAHASLMRAPREDASALALGVAATPIRRPQLTGVCIGAPGRLCSPCSCRFVGLFGRLAPAPLRPPLPSSVACAFEIACVLAWNRLRLRFHIGALCVCDHTPVPRPPSVSTRPGWRPPLRPSRSAPNGSSGTSRSTRACGGRTRLHRLSRRHCASLSRGSGRSRARSRSHPARGFSTRAALRHNPPLTRSHACVPHHTHAQARSLTPLAHARMSRRGQAGARVCTTRAQPLVGDGVRAWGCCFGRARAKGAGEAEKPARCVTEATALGRGGRNRA